MSRSSKKGAYVYPSLMKKIRKLLELPLEERDRYPIKTWKRASTIIPEMVGMIFEVHNGKQFIKVKIIDDMVGHKLGEFAPTTKFVKHGGKLQRELEQKLAKQK